MKWYYKPLRAAALQCNYEQGRNLEMVDKWAAMGFNAEYLKHLFDTEKMADFDPARHGALLDEYLSRAHARGIRVILYFNVHILTGSNVERKDEWAQRDEQGGFMMNYSTFYSICLRGGYRDYFLRVLDSMAEHDVDGVFMDGPVIMGKGCWCDSCRAAFLEERGHEMKEGTERELFDFNADSMSLFLKEAYRRFKAKKPDGLFHNNLPSSQFEASFYRFPQVLEYNDLIGTEGGFFFYGPPRNAYLWRNSVTCKCLEAIAPDTARMNCLASNQMPWSWYMHTAVETKLCIASTFANGAGIWYGLHGASLLLETPGGRAAAECIRWMAEHEGYYEDAKPASSVAVLHSMDTERAYRLSAGESDLYGKARDRNQFSGNFTEAFHGVCDALCRSSIPFDVVSDACLDAEKLRRYSLLFLPTCACLSDYTVSLIRDYVAQGGNIVANHESSLYDEEGKPRPDFGLADVFGASSAGGGATAHNTWDYFSTCGSHALFDGLDIPLYPAPLAGLDIEPHQGAEILARFHAPMPGRYDPLTAPDKPAIVLNRHGKGTSLFLSGTFFELFQAFSTVEYRRIINNAVNMLARLPVRLEGQVGNVELVVRTQQGRLLVHMVNYLCAPPRPFEKICPQSGLRLRVNAGRKPRKVEALRAKTSCKWAMEDAGLVIEAPELNDFEAIVITW